MASGGSNVVPLGALTQKPSSKNDAELDIELGVGGILPGGAWQDWSGGPTAAGTYTVGRDPNAPDITELVQMGRKDGQARALLSLLSLPMRAALKDGAWAAPEGEDPDGASVKFANDMWNLPPNGGGMTVPKSKLLRQTLLSLLHGFSSFEHVRQICPAGPNKGKITIRKMAYRDPRTVFFLTDGNGGYNGIRQITSFVDRTVNVVIPPEKSWYFAVNEEENPFYGVSYFEPALEHYQIKRKLYYISHIAAQFSAVPGRLGMLPPNPNKGQLEQFRSALQNFSFNTSMLVPDKYDVKPFNNNSQFNFLQYIDHHNTMMASSVLAKFLQQEDRQVLIDNGKGDASADMFVQMLQAITNELAESWSNHLMPQYIDYNFSGKDAVYPEFKFAPLTDDQRADIIAVFNSIVIASTLNCTPEFVRQTEERMSKIFGYDIDYEKIALEEKKAADAQAQAQQDQADAAAAAQQQAPNPNGPVDPAASAQQTAQQQAQPPAQGTPSNVVAASAAEVDASLDAMIVAMAALAETEELEVLPEDED